MQSQVSKDNEQTENTQANSPAIQAKKTVTPGSIQTNQSQLPPVQTKQGNKPPIQSKQGSKPPIQTKEGRKGPIQAKQRPVQRNTGEYSVQGGTTNEARVKERVSSLMQTDVTQAKVHYNSDKPAQLKAEATAQGNEVHLAPGKEKHLGHELTHVAQQKKGDVPVTTQANNGVGINDDPQLEKEADDIGAIAMGNQTIQAKMPETNSGQVNTNSQPVQRVSAEDAPQILLELQGQFPELTASPELLWSDFEKYVQAEFAGEGLSILEDMSIQDAKEFITPYLSKYLITSGLRGRAGSLPSTEAKLNDRGMPSKLIGEIEQDPYRMASVAEQMHVQETTPLSERSRKNGQGKLQQTTPRLRNETYNTAKYLRRIMADAALSKREFDEGLDVIGSKIHRADVEHASLKGWDRAYEKTTTKYRNDPSLVLDIVRGSIIFENVGSLVHARKHVIPSVFRVERSKGNIGKDSETGYQDMKVNVRLSTGHIAELQLHLRSMVESKQHKGGHGLYRFIRAADENKAYAPDDIPKAIAKLNPVLDTLNDRSLNIPSSKKGRYITFIRWLMDQVRAGNAVQLTGWRKTMIKEISQIVYSGAAKDVHRELFMHPDVARSVNEFNG